jgi:hypothetical protein
MCNKFIKKQCYCIDECEKLLRKIQTGGEIYHAHSTTCGHDKICHNGHIDYIVDGRLHHPHITHCDDHGPITVVKQGDQGSHIVAANKSYSLKLPSLIEDFEK